MKKFRVVLAAGTSAPREAVEVDAERFAVEGNGTLILYGASGEIAKGGLCTDPAAWTAVLYSSPTVAAFADGDWESVREVKP